MILNVIKLLWYNRNKNTWVCAIGYWKRINFGVMTETPFHVSLRHTNRSFIIFLLKNALKCFIPYWAANNHWTTWQLDVWKKKMKTEMKSYRPNAHWHSPHRFASHLHKLKLCLSFSLHLMQPTQILPPITLNLKFHWSWMTSSSFKPSNVVEKRANK